MNSDSFTYDVFIAYSSSDRVWVRSKLLPQLEKSGLKVCIDYRNFQQSAPIVMEIERALRVSRKTLLVLTPSYQGSEWTYVEQFAVQPDHPVNREQRIVPILKERYSLPQSMQSFTIIDFTSADPTDKKIAWTQLLTALGFPPTQELPEPPNREHWLLVNPYTMDSHFIGRVYERDKLSAWLNTDHDHPMMLLYALGGSGKTALAWQWVMHHIHPGRWSRVVWWSFQEDNTCFEQFLTKTLEYLKIDPYAYGPHQQVDRLLHIFQQPESDILIVLDGFDHILCNLPGPSQHQRISLSLAAEYFLSSMANSSGIRSKLLVTTRLIPHVLETNEGKLLDGCCLCELKPWQAADAIDFLRTHGIRGGRLEIEQVCVYYGYHPLSLRILAGLLTNDSHQPGDIALARSANIVGDMPQRQHHLVHYAIEVLSPEEYDVLCCIATCRGTVPYTLLRAVEQTKCEKERNHTEEQPEKKKSLISFLKSFLPLQQESAANASSSYEERLERNLHCLVLRGLLSLDRATRCYKIHHYIRQYAYPAIDVSKRISHHMALREYFTTVQGPKPARNIQDLAPAIEWYHHTVGAALYDEACAFFKENLFKPMFFEHRNYYLCIELLQMLWMREDQDVPHLKDEHEQVWAMNVLAHSYALTGKPYAAVPFFENHIAILERMHEQKNLPIAIASLARMAYMPLGKLRLVETMLRRGITICKEIADDVWDALLQAELGRLLAYRGEWMASEKALETAWELSEKRQQVQMQSTILSYRALRGLLMARMDTPAPFASSSDGEKIQRQGDIKEKAVSLQEKIQKIPEETLQAAQKSLEILEHTSQAQNVLEPDHIRARWMIGAAQRMSGAWDEAAHYLNESLTRCQRANLIEFEADILLEQARLFAMQDNHEEALKLAQKALFLTERCGYVLQGADVHLFLAHEALSTGHKHVAQEHAKIAREYAKGDGTPGYTYKVVYDDASHILRMG